MNERESSVPRVVLPERLNRPARVGPFATARDALKFLALGGFGALVALRWGPLLWLPFLAVGLLLTVRPPDGDSLDERGLAYLRWRLTPADDVDSAVSTRGAGRFARGPDGGVCAGYSTGGIPVAYLPAREAERIFEAFRAALRGSDLDLHLRVGRGPIRLEPGPKAPPPNEGGDARAARLGYYELLELLTRRRNRRRVELLMVAPGGLAAYRRLEDHLAHFARFFDTVGIDYRPLRGPELGACGASVSRQR